MSDDDNTDWSKVDSDWVAENRPDKLSKVHHERLMLKHGEKRGDEKYQAAVINWLGKVKITPPYRGGR